MKKMKIIFLPRYNYWGASSRYRHFMLSKFLNESNVKTSIYPFFEKKDNKIIFYLYYFIKRFLIIIFNKNSKFYVEGDIFPYLPFNLLLPKYYIIDLDDPLWNLEKINTKYNTKKWTKLIQNSSFLVSGSPFTLKYWKKKCKNLLTHFTPTTFKSHFYSIPSKSLNERKIGGWIGSPSTSKYVDDLFDKEQDLVIEFNWILVGYKGKYKNYKNVKVLDWSKYNEEAMAINSDFAISPLTYDSKISDYKCGFKIVQYLALGLNTIINDVGANKIWKDSLGVHTVNLNWHESIKNSNFIENNRIQSFFKENIASENVFIELKDKIQAEFQ
ncbi:hypothetical protein [Polaribacter marinivivus]|uniref:hypothetical protein n=2 Tax=Polaribacter marinivivus TaxID=1524260 RepID=UPI003D815ACC